MFLWRGSCLDGSIGAARAVRRNVVRTSIRADELDRERRIEKRGDTGLLHCTKEVTSFQSTLGETLSFVVEQESK